MGKRLLMIVISAAMIIALLPLSAFAVTPQQEITLAGPFVYDEEKSIMLTVQEAEGFKLGDSIYYLIIDETIGKPADHRRYVSTLEIKDGASYSARDLISKIEIAKKKIDVSAFYTSYGENFLYNCGEILKNYNLDSGYYYFLELKTVDKKITFPVVVSFGLQFDRKAWEGDADKVEKIEGSLSDIEFSLAPDRDWEMKSLRGWMEANNAILEPNTSYYLEIDESGKTRLTLDVGDQEYTLATELIDGELLLPFKYTTDKNDGVIKTNPDAKLKFINIYDFAGNAVKLDKKGEVVLPPRAIPTAI